MEYKPDVNMTYKMKPYTQTAIIDTFSSFSPLTLIEQKDSKKVINRLVDIQNRNEFYFRRNLFKSSRLYSANVLKDEKKIYKCPNKCGNIIIVRDFNTICYKCGQYLEFNINSDCYNKGVLMRDGRTLN